MLKIYTVFWNFEVPWSETPVKKNQQLIQQNTQQFYPYRDPYVRVMIFDYTAIAFAHDFNMKPYTFVFFNARSYDYKSLAHIYVYNVNAPSLLTKQAGYDQSLNELLVLSH